MKPMLYLFLAALLLLFAYVVFRIIVRRDYRSRGRLSALSSILQLLVFMGFFIYPYLFNPPEWAWFWRGSDTSSRTLHFAGLLLICIGFVVAFGTMAWFGIQRAFGISVDGLKVEGPYKISRNPQIIGGYLLVIGTALQWPSLYSLGWVVMYAIIGHWMILSEEEHLHRIFGEAYEDYCSEVPRYLLAHRK